MAETISITGLQGPLESIEQIMVDAGQTSGFNDNYPDVTPRSRGELIALGARVREISGITDPGSFTDLSARVQALEEGF